MKKNLCVCLTMVLLVFCTMKDSAISAYTVAPNETFTISLACGVMEGKVSVNAYNANVVNAGDWCERNKGISVKATAGNEGVAEVSLVAVDVTNTDTMTEFEGTISSIAINVVGTTPSEPPKETPTETPTDTPIAPATTPSETKTPTSEQKKTTENKAESTVKNEESKEQTTLENEKSAVSSLSELRVSQGVLTPTFRSNTHTYTLNLDDTAPSMTIEAKATDQKAQIEGVGEVALKHGDQTLDVICKAEDGTSTTYSINVNVIEKPTIQLPYGTAKLGVLKTADTSSLSAAFQETTITIDGNEVTAWKNEGSKVTLLYLMNEKMERDFYIYEEGNGVVSIYRPIALCGKNLVMIDIPQNLRDRNNMSFGMVNVDGVDLQGWSFDDKDFETYALIYMMDEQGNKAYYQYESTTNTLQPFSGAAAITQTDFEKFVEEHKQVLLYGGLGLGVLLLLCIVLGISARLNYRRKKQPNVPYKKMLHEHDLGQDFKIESKLLSERQAKNKEDS